MPVGAVEVPDGDELLVLHRGRGVTAGYPVLAVVTSVGLSRARAGPPRRDRPLPPRDAGEAVTAYRSQRLAIRALAARVHTVFDELRIPLPSVAGHVPSTVEFHCHSPSPHVHHSDPATSRCE